MSNFGVTTPRDVFLGFNCVEEQVKETIHKIRNCPLVPRTIAVASFIYDTESGEIKFIQEL